MQPRIKEKQFLSYSIIEKQIRAVPVFNEMMYQNHDIFDMNDFVKWLPKLPKADISISPSLSALKARYEKIIDLAKSKRCSLVDLYKEVFLNLWNENNIVQLKQAMKAALNQGTISVSTHYFMDEFLKDLKDEKAGIESAIKRLPSESKHVQNTKQEVQSIEQEVKNTEQDILQKRATQNLIENCGLKHWLSYRIKETLAEGLPGWKQYIEARQGFSLELNNYEVFSALGCAEPWRSARVEAWEKLFQNRKAMLPEDHKLYQVAVDFENTPKHHIESIINFINIHYEDFPESFKEKVNQSKVDVYINHFYCPKLPEEVVRITWLPVEPSKNIKKSFNFAQINNDFADLCYEWDYVASLDDFISKDWYRIAALLYEIKKPRLYHYEGFFYSVWQHAIDDLLIKSDLTAEAQAAVVQASLACLANKKHYKKYLHGFVSSGNEKSPKLGLIRNKLLTDLEHKEPQYYAAMPPEPEMTKSIDQRYDKELATTLFLRLIAVYYIRNALLSGKELSSQKMRNELITQFGEEIVATRGCRESHISKILNELDIPAISTPGFFVKEHVKTVESKSEQIKELKMA